MSIELFNDKAHRILSEVLDIAEERLVRSGVCEPGQAGEYLTVAYIKVCGGLLERASVYLESEERIGADIFLYELSKGAARTGYARNHRACAKQLAMHTHIYFPHYEKCLRVSYLDVLASTAKVDELCRSGVLLLAAATLPGVRTDIRRELRRRGATYEPLLVRDDTMQRITGRTSILSMVKPQHSDAEKLA